MTRRTCLMTLALMVWASIARAQVDVVATTSSMEMLARTVGGQHVSVTTLAPPDRDAHYLLAKPSMMIALRRADLLVAVGAELEIGWLPVAIQGANNPKIVPGQPGYFEGAAQIDLLEKGVTADRSRGDIHPLGNPHYYMDPVRMVTIAHALAGRLAALDPANAAAYRSNADGFERMVNDRLPRWRSMAANSPGVVFYHKDGEYLAALLGTPVLGYVEPLPGIPPTASHLRDLVQRLTGQRGVILYNSYHSSNGPDFLARNLGWPKAQLQLEVSLKSDAAGYLDHIDRWVTAIASGKS
ncbi:MAG TPA: zinc ABC transporter substrate-binding protein [Vicinamibacterales bacterium]